MGLSFQKGADMPKYTTKDRIVVNAAQDRIVAESSAEAAFVLASAAGKEIPMHIAEKLGLVKQAKPANDKQAKPLRNKAAKTADTKEQSEVLVKNA